MEFAVIVAFGMLGLAAILFVIRLLISRSLADRMVALDSLLMTVVSGIAVQAARTGQDTYLNVMVVTALLAFVSTTLIARFIKKRGD